MSFTHPAVWTFLIPFLNAKIRNSLFSRTEFNETNSYLGDHGPLVVVCMKLIFSEVVVSVMLRDELLSFSFLVIYLYLNSITRELCINVPRFTFNSMVIELVCLFRIFTFIEFITVSLFRVVSVRPFTLTKPSLGAICLLWVWAICDWSLVWSAQSSYVDASDIVCHELFKWKAEKSPSVQTFYWPHLSAFAFLIIHVVMT